MIFNTIYHQDVGCHIKYYFSQEQLHITSVSRIYTLLKFTNGRTDRVSPDMSIKFQ